MIPTILVIEDNTLNLQLVRDLLTAGGMKVVEARSTRTLPNSVRTLLDGGSPGHSS